MPKPEKDGQQSQTPEQEIAELRAKLAAAEKAREDSEAELERVRASTQAALLLSNSVTEVFLRKEPAQKWDPGKRKLVPTEVEIWSYRIDLPPSGGYGAKLNGVDYFHGETYEVDTDTLRVLKDIVHRCWQHEANIRGSNENFYRKESAHVLRGGERRA